MVLLVLISRITVAIPGSPAAVGPSDNILFNSDFSPNILTILYPIVFENGFTHPSNNSNIKYNRLKTINHGINVEINTSKYLISFPLLHKPLCICKLVKNIPPNISKI